MRRPTDHDEAAEQLAEVARIRTATRDGVASLAWHSTVLWGVVFLGSVVARLIFERGLGSAVYWMTAVPLAVGLSWRVEAPLPQLTTNRPFAMWFSLISASVLVGAFGVWYVVEERLAALIWLSILLAGLAASAILERHHQAIGGLTLLWIWGVAVWWSTSDSEADIELTISLFSTAIGAGLIGLGFGRRLSSR